MMDAEAADRWRRVEEIFHRALDLEGTAEERTASVRAWCGEDASLAEDVLSLVASAQEVERPPEGARKTAAHPCMGRTLGSYRVVALIGRGGMGAVYAAVRASGAGGDDEQVALKVVGTRLYSPQLQERFLEERRALAVLRHAHIARLLDGGVSDEGEPYFVMEYIRGERLDQYCERAGLRAREIARLFLDLCDAVAYAHRNRILHGDLKPGNVLVTADGQVKLLDFGAATLLAGGEEQAAPMAAFTPQYASPEQRRGEPCTAASDVYSLGVALYRLLTGHVPAAATTLAFRTGAAGEETASADWAEIEDEDLRAIAGKAMRAEPEGRYATVTELAAELQRWMEHRPVRARKTARLYRAWKLLRRNRERVVAGAALLAVLAAGADISLRAARTARGEELRAREEMRNVRLLATFLVTDFYDRLGEVPGATETQRKVAAEALEFLDGMAQNARGDFDFELDLANAYTRMGNVMGSPYQDNLGEAPEAIRSVERAISIAEDALRLHPDDARALRHAEFAQRSLSEIEFGDGQTKQALDHARAAAALCEKLLSAPGAEPADLHEAATLYALMGDEYGLHGASSLGDTDKAIENYQRAIGQSRAALARNAQDTRAVRSIALGDIKIANLLSEAQPETAQKQYEEALAMLGRIPNAPVSIKRLRGVVRQKLGDCYFYEGKFRESLKELEQARQVMGSYAEKDPLDMRLKQDMASIYLDEGESHEALSDWNAAQRDYERLTEVLTTALRSDPGNRIWQEHYAETLIARARVEERLKQTAQAEEHERKGLALSLQLAQSAEASPDDLDSAAMYLLDAQVKGLRDPRRALAFSSRAVALIHGSDPEFLLTLARAQAACHETAAARASVTKILGMQAGRRIRRGAESLLRSLHGGQ